MHTLKQNRHYYHHFLFLIAALIAYLMLTLAQDSAQTIEPIFWLIVYVMNTFFILNYFRSFSFANMRLAFLTFSWVLYGVLSDWLADGIYLQIMLPLMVIAIASICLDAQVINE